MTIHGLFPPCCRFPAKIAFPSEDLPVLVEFSGGHGDTGILETGAKKFNIRRRACRRNDSVDRAGRGAAPTSLTVRHGLPVTVDRAPVFCHASAISLS
jgi:hypothetical protein